MGVPVILSGHLTRTALLIAAAAGAATVAAGCGSQVATTTSATRSASPSTASPGGIIPGGPVSKGSVALCSKQAGVTRLVVSRVSALPQNHLHFAFPAGITVSSPARARAVAGMVCGLPAVPQGAMSCPADWGVSYRLQFAAGSASFPVVTARAGGCGVVTGAGPARWPARVPGFWTVLAHAMGLSGGAALQGTHPVSQGGPVS
jgi:type IV pilus biogenesis protein CpaD/CtpE